MNVNNKTIFITLPVLLLASALMAGCALIKTNGDAGIDMLVAESGITNSKIAAILLSREFNGVIKCLPGKRYQLL